MSNSEVGDYTPIPGSQPAPLHAAQPGAGGAIEVPAASVREVRAPEPEPVRYHYVLRPAPPSFHIVEETTGLRVTTFPIQGEAQAEDVAERYNRQQAAP